MSIREYLICAALLVALEAILPGWAEAACPLTPAITRTPTIGSPFASDNRDVTRMDTQTSDNVRITGGCVEGITLGMRDTVSAASLGPELVTNGSFTGSASGWTLGSGWAYGTNSVAWTVGAGAALSQNITVVSGTQYLVQLDNTQSASGNGSITPSIGAVSGSPITFYHETCVPEGCDGQQAVITAGASGSLSLAFTGASVNGGGTITLDNVSVKAITPVTPAATLRDSVGADSGPQFYSGGAGLGNSFFGLGSGLRTTSGFQNSGIGYNALLDNTSGRSNTAVGAFALATNTNGFGNTGIGAQALRFNTADGHGNTAVGYLAMLDNLTGAENTGIGVAALQHNLYGWSNVGIGDGALQGPTFPFQCVAVGNDAGNPLTTCGGATFVGADIMFGAGVSAINTTMIGNNVASNVTDAINTLIIGSSGRVVASSATPSNYTNIENIIEITGTNVPATSVTTVNGNLVANNLIKTDGASAGFVMNSRTGSGTNFTWYDPAGASACLSPGYDAYCIDTGGNGTWTGAAGGNVVATLKANQTTGFSARLDLQPRAAAGGGIVQTTVGADLSIGANSDIKAVAVQGGGFRSKINNVTKTTNYTVSATTDYGTSFDNSGASGSVTFTLPAAAAGLRYCFLVVAAQNVTIDAAGTDLIYLGTSVTSAGGTQSANAIGASVCIQAQGTGAWFSTGHEGTWTAA